MRRKTDLLGQKIGYLIVISESETINKLVRWRCRCVCGNETVKFANDLKRRKKFISCGCKANLHKGRKKYDPITKSAAAIYNANYKRDSDMTLDEFIQLSQQKCHYCKAGPSNKFCVKRGKIFHYNGLDRVDSSKPHIKNNCVTCCRWCNAAKDNRSVKDFIDWIDRLYHNLSS
jgi:hypothetical protein